MEEIPVRLKADGWDAVRPAISITIMCVEQDIYLFGSSAKLGALDSGWVMRAFIDDRIKDDIETALEFFASAMDLLRWGKELWKDVPFEEKGEVFRPAFIRGVRCLHLEALLRVCHAPPPSMRLNYL